MSVTGAVRRREICSDRLNYICQKYDYDNQQHNTSKFSSQVYVIFYTNFKNFSCNQKYSLYT